MSVLGRIFNSAEQSVKIIFHALFVQPVKKVKTRRLLSNLPVLFLLCDKCPQLFYFRLCHSAGNQVICGILNIVCFSKLIYVIRSV